MFFDWIKAFGRPDWHNASQRMQLEYLEAIYSQNQTILENQLFIIKKIHDMDKNVQDLIDAVTAETEVEKSVVTLLETLAGDLQSGIDAGDLAAIQATTTQIKANTAVLAASVLKNTPPVVTPVVTDPGAGTGAAAGDAGAAQ